MFNTALSCLWKISVWNSNHNLLISRLGPFLPILPVLPYPGFNPHTEILPKGHKRRPYNLALPCDIVFTQDFAILLRDGIKIYCDIFRPLTEKVNGEKVPIIMVWAPYGKHGNSELFMNELPERLGIERQTYSGYENFEGPDPAFWVPRGYAVVHVDARGSWNSEGDMYFWGNNVCVVVFCEAYGY